MNWLKRLGYSLLFWAEEALSDYLDQAEAYYRNRRK